MIERYAKPEMRKIWQPENKFQKWLDVEIAACEAHNEMGNIPKEALEVIKKKSAFKVERIDEIERTTNHDVIAFLTNVAENVGPDSRFIHLGLTSSDVVDTAFAILIKESVEIIIKDVKLIRDTLKKRAKEFKDTIMIGRTHGVHAEPMTFGLKLALWYDELGRGLRRLEQARETISVGAISGAVGTYANIDPKIEELVCKKLGLTPVNISTQILQRDRHAEVMTTLALVAASIERFSTEIRGLQKTETYEVEEAFGKGQKGSSAMPHKKNPITSERLTGLARVIRGYALTSLENIALWHERDISHSSTERIIFPDGFVTLDYMLQTFNNLVSGLVVHPENMLRNLNSMGGMVFSQRVLLKLVDAGITREDAYVLVQKNAMKIRDEGGTLKEHLLKDKNVTSKISAGDIEELFDFKYHLKYTDKIMERVFSA
jgi:adenylosuccinate lyase